MKILIALLLMFNVSCGVKGEKGDQGERGLTGEQGVKGDVGEAGLPGRDGSDGLNGKDGTSYEDFLSGFFSKVSIYNDSILDIECNNWRGTGAKVSNERILTAFHVVDGATSCFYFSDGVLVGSGGTYKQVGTKDQAFITGIKWYLSSIKEIPFAADYKVKLGEPLLLLSYPLDIVYNVQYTFGRVTDDLVTDSDLGTHTTVWKDAFTSDMVATSGSSGAPIFNKEGVIIGIHVGGYSSTNLDLNFQIPVSID